LKWVTHSATMSSLVRMNSSDNLSLNETRRASVIKVKTNTENKNKTDKKKKKKNRTGVVDNTGSSLQLDDSYDTEIDLEQTIMNTKSHKNNSVKKKKQAVENGDTNSIRNNGYQSTDDDDVGIAINKAQPIKDEGFKKTYRTQPITGNTDDGRPTMSKRRQPITAWSVDVDNSEPETKMAENESSEPKKVNSNQSLACNSDDVVEMREMLESLSGNIERTEESIISWKQQRKSTKQINEESCRTLERRRIEIEEMLRSVVDSMIEELDTEFSDTAQQLETCIKTGENNLRGMRKIYEKYSSLPDNNRNYEKLKAMMVKVQHRCGKVAPPAAILENVKLQPLGSQEEQTEAIKSLLGYNVTVGRPSSHDTAPGRSVVQVPSTIEPKCFRLPDGFLEAPQFMQFVTCRWKKDKRSCGITDLALTDDGRVFAVDHNNKSVKMFDSIQVNYIIDVVNTGSSSMQATVFGNKCILQLNKM